MSRALSPKPNLEQLRRQAKDLLRAYKGGDPEAVERFAQHTRLGKNTSEDQDRLHLKLAVAQLVLAREYGFASWPKLVQHVQQGLMEQPAEPKRAPEALASETRSQAVLRATASLQSAAEQGDLAQLFATLRVGRRFGDAVRAQLIATGAYTRVIDAFLVAAGHKADRVRFLAAQAMDHFADQRCAPVLTRLLDDHTPRVRWAALHSLQCAACKPEPLQPDTDMAGKLIDMALHDPSVKVRRVATYELGELCSDHRVPDALHHIVARTTDAATLRNARNALTKARRRR